MRRFILLIEMTALFVLFHGCVAQHNNKCSFIINNSKSNAVEDKDSICYLLENLSLDSSGLFFYFSDTLPPNYEEKRIAQGFEKYRVQKKPVVVFIALKDRRFTTYFEYDASSVDYLNRMQLFEQHIFDLVNKERVEMLSQSIYLAYIDIFKSKKLKAF